MLYTKGVYANKSDSDGLRICVMSRLTLNDGVTPVQDLVNGRLFEYWMKALAPPPKLVGAWFRERISWDEFSVQYTAHILEPGVREHVDLVASLALTRDVTLLCSEDSPQQCHRRLLALACRSVRPGLELHIA